MASKPPQWKARRLFPAWQSFLLINPVRRLTAKRDKVMAWAGIVPGQDVLELGSGPGFFTPALARKVQPGRVYALDVQRKMAAKLKERILRKKLENVKCLVADAAYIPLSAESVDRVFANQALEEVQKLEGAIGEVKRVLRPGGELAIIQYWFDFSLDMREAMKAIIAAFGFLPLEETCTRFAWKARYKKD